MVTFRLCENERLKWKQQDGGKWGDHGSTPASAGTLRGSVSGTRTDRKIGMFCRIRHLLRHTYLKIIKPDPAKDCVKNLLEFSRHTHLFWRVQGRLKTFSSSVGMSECCIAMSAQLRTPGCTQGPTCNYACWTPLYEKAHHRPGESREVQALFVRMGQYCDVPCFFCLRAEDLSVVQLP